MNRNELFSNCRLLLVLPAVLFFIGCNAKDETKSSPLGSPQSNNVSAISSDTNVVSLEGNKTESSFGISGKIILKGTPPPERDLIIDSSCGSLHQTPLKTRLYVVGNGGALGDVFIYIKDGLSGKIFPAPDKPVLLDQVGCEYTPYVVGLQTNQKLLVRNSDPMMHNVHPMPNVAGNKESNKAQMPKAPDLEYVFENPELFLPFKCQVHPWMVGYVCVVEHPFFAVSGKDGTFQIKNVPAGKYLVEAYHRKAGKQTREITVADGASPPIEFTFEIPASQ